MRDSALASFFYERQGWNSNRGEERLVLLHLTHHLLLLNLRVNIVHRFDILTILNSSQIVLCNLNNQWRKSQDTDKVRNHHKAVKGIGNIPCLGTVVGPAEHGSECKQEHGNGNKLAADTEPWEYGVEGTANEGFRTEGIHKNRLKCRQNTAPGTERWNLLSKKYIC